MKITIFTDGSALGNPGKSGWGAVVQTPEMVTELGGAEDNSTNNRMEMTAIVEALVFVGDIKDEIVVNSDSQYTMNGITKWIGGWKANGWKTKNKTDVLNKDIWQKLDEATQGKKITWNYVAGHVGIPGNERVDAIANGFAGGKAPGLFKGNKSDYIVDLSITKAPEGATKKGGSKSSAKAYSYLSLINGELQKHEKWSECEARVKGKKAKFKKALSKDHEEEIVKEWMG